MPDKLARGLAELAQASSGPALYCGRRWDWFPETGRKRATAVPGRPLGFRNALVENVAFGNTILLNPAAARQARQAALRTGPVFAHDWWLYLLITGAGGCILFDRGAPRLLYRQHSGNALGAGHGIAAAMARKRGVLAGLFRERVSRNVEALSAVSDLLTPENRTILRGFEEARKAGPFARLAQLAHLHPHRQTVQGNLGFWGAALLGKV